MGRVLFMSSKVRSKATVKQLKQRFLFNEALAKSKRSTGIDFYKLITGDPEERQRFNMRQNKAWLDDSK